MNICTAKIKHESSEIIEVHFTLLWLLVLYICYALSIQFLKLAAGNISAPLKAKCNTYMCVSQKRPSGLDRKRLFKNDT